MNGHILEVQDLRNEEKISVKLLDERNDMIDGHKHGDWLILEI
jgi:hypothetical protein